MSDLLSDPDYADAALTGWTLGELRRFTAAVEALPLDRVLSLIEETEPEEGGETPQQLADQAEVVRAAVAFRNVARGILARLEADERGEARDQ